MQVVPYGGNKKRWGYRTSEGCSNTRTIMHEGGTPGGYLVISSFAPFAGSSIRDVRYGLRRLRPMSSCHLDSVLSAEQLPLKHTVTATPQP